MTEEKIMEIAELFTSCSFGIEKGDRILVLTDNEVSDGDELGRMRDAVVRVMDREGLDPCVMSFRAGHNMGYSIPAAAEAACMASDLIVSFNTSLLLYAENFPEIYQGGKTGRRIAMFPAGSSIKGDTDYFERMIPDTEGEILGMAGLTEKYGRMLMDGKEHALHITAANGTDLFLKVGLLSGSAHKGICEAGTIELIPAGILSLGVSEGSAEGTLVADYSTTLRKEPLRGRICFGIHDGYAVSVYGGEEAEEFKASAAASRKTDREKFNIAEFGMGFNQRAKADGQVTDGENIMGAVHVGIGSNSLFGGNIAIPEWHVDCIIPGASVESDGKFILKDGEYCS